MATDLTAVKRFILSLVCAIHPNDHQARLRFVGWAQNEMAVVPIFISEFCLAKKRTLMAASAQKYCVFETNPEVCRKHIHQKKEIVCLLR
ncbi:hypothetical protein TNCV_4976361 [Trichonephila clavipes]|nr:hypothetical protein TNCV_4976361 [Trichonephila clavipes]